MNTGFDMPADVTFADDLDVQLDADTYQDRALPLPFMPGNYAVRIKKAGLKKKKDSTELDLQDGKYPVIKVEQLEVVSPEEAAGRIVNVYQDFRTKPYMEKDFGTGIELPANNLAKILRSHDVGISFRDLQEGLATFQQLVGEAATFHVQIDWKAEDWRWAKEQVDLLNAEAARTGKEVDRKVLNDIRYKQGAQEGFRKFVQKDGTIDPIWISPSGEEIEARPFIRTWISTAQLDKFKLGAKKA